MLAIIPGLSLSILLGVSALLLSEYYASPAMLFALLLGLALSFLHENDKFKAGIEFTACHVLRFGVALLGLRIVLADLLALGWQTAAMLLLAISSTLVVGLTLAKILKLPKSLGVLTGGAVGICGASAALAIAAVLPNSQEKQRYTLLTIVCITALSTMAMLLYPVLANLLELSPTHVGIFLGATIHDVAQVVGAGYSVSEPTGDLATLTKLVRVAFLMPVVLVIVLILAVNQRKSAHLAVQSKTPVLPLFLLVFVLLMLLNSLLNIPASITQSATDLSRYALVIAIAAIGLKSNLSQLQSVGFKPILLIVLETLWLATFVILCLGFI